MPGIADLPTWARTIGELGLDFTPIVGDIKAAFHDAPREFAAGNKGMGLLALASAVPVFSKFGIDQLRAGLKAERGLSELGRAGKNLRHETRPMFGIDSILVKPGHTGLKSSGMPYRVPTMPGRWYSRLVDTVLAEGQESMPAADWLKRIEKQVGFPEEGHVSGLYDQLRKIARHGVQRVEDGPLDYKVSKDEIIGMLSQDPVRIGEQYRYAPFAKKVDTPEEAYLAHPSKHTEVKPEYGTWVMRGDRGINANPPDYREILMYADIPGVGGVSKGHWYKTGPQNTILSLRMTTRSLVDGEIVDYVDELQSDIAQGLRTDAIRALLGKKFQIDPSGMTDEMVRKKFADLRAQGLADSKMIDELIPFQFRSKVEMADYEDIGRRLEDTIVESSRLRATTEKDFLDLLNQTADEDVARIMHQLGSRRTSSSQIFSRFGNTLMRAGVDERRLEEIEELARKAGLSESMALSPTSVPSMGQLRGIVERTISKMPSDMQRAIYSQGDAGLATEAVEAAQEALEKIGKLYKENAGRIFPDLRMNQDSGDIGTSLGFITPRDAFDALRTSVVQDEGLWPAIGGARRSPLLEKVYAHKKLMNSIDDLEEQRKGLEKLLPPNFPYVTDTKKWTTLGVRRALQEGHQHGRNVVFPNAAQVESSVGGDMEGYYDKIVPSIVRKEAKKLGADVEIVTLEGGLSRKPEQIFQPVEDRIRDLRTIHDVELDSFNRGHHPGEAIDPQFADLLEPRAVMEKDELIDVARNTLKDKILSRIKGKIHRSDVWGLVQAPDPRRSKEMVLEAIEDVQRESKFLGNWNWTADKFTPPNTVAGAPQVNQLVKRVMQDATLLGGDDLVRYADDVDYGEIATLLQEEFDDIFGEITAEILAEMNSPRTMGQNLMVRFTPKAKKTMVEKGLPISSMLPLAPAGAYALNRLQRNREQRA